MVDRSGGPRARAAVILHEVLCPGRPRVRTALACLSDFAWYLAALAWHFWDLWFIMVPCLHGAAGLVLYTLGALLAIFRRALSFEAP